MNVAIPLRVIHVLVFIIFQDVRATIDINYPEFQYLADHLTEKECRQLVTALYFKEFEISPSLDAAEKELPRDVSCVDLLLFWNSTPNAGKGETHILVCHRLNQIGRTDLAIWLTRTVFHELSKDLEDSLTQAKVSKKTKECSTWKSHEDEQISNDEATWWKFDIFLSVILVFGLVSLFIELLFLCLLKLTKNSMHLDKWPSSND